MVACQTSVSYPDIEVDLSPMRLFPAPVGSEPSISAEQAIDVVIAADGPTEVVRMGKRLRGDGAMVWVVIHRPVAGDPCPDCWVGRVVSGGPSASLDAGFDAASLRAFKIPVPDW